MIPWWLYVCSNDTGANDACAHDASEKWKDQNVFVLKKFHVRRDGNPLLNNWKILNMKGVQGKDLIYE